MSFAQYEDALNVIDSMPQVISGYVPSVEELQKHNVEGDFEKYSRMLLAISENITSMELADFDASEKERITATNRYINALFKKNLK